MTLRLEFNWFWFCCSIALSVQCAGTVSSLTTSFSTLWRRFARQWVSRWTLPWLGTPGTRSDTWCTLTMLTDVVYQNISGHWLNDNCNYEVKLTNSIPKCSYNFDCIKSAWSYKSRIIRRRIVKQLFRLGDDYRKIPEKLAGAFLKYTKSQEYIYHSETNPKHWYM